MISTMTDQKSWMTAQTESGFVMPASGATLGAGTGVAVAADVCFAPAYAVRDRHIAVFPTARPGSTAWSPPTC